MTGETNITIVGNLTA
ncbi:MAG: hypothetical protein K0S70_4731, partial [Microbacterium sp.]|nr:hypothetical protein [Microbacterium sp.]